MATEKQEVIKRLQEYLASTIANKEAEQLKLEGELSGLRTALTTLQMFIQQGAQ